MKIVRWVVPVLFSVLTGCMQHQMVVKVKQDGSGTIEATNLIYKILYDQSMARGGLPISEKLAKNFGEDVTLISREKAVNGEFEGLKAVFAFKDCTKLKIQLGSKDQLVIVHFSKMPSGNALLTVACPQIKPHVSPVGGKKSTMEEIQKKKAMLKGLKFSVTIEVEGRVVKTNALALDGSRLILMELDGDKLLADEAKLNEIMIGNPQTIEDVRDLLKNAKGVKLPPVGEVSIEFAKR